MALNKAEEDTISEDYSDMNNNESEDEGWIDLVENIQQFREGVIFFATGLYCNRYIAGTHECLTDYLTHFLLYLKQFKNYMENVPVYLQKTREYEEGTKLYKIALDNYLDA